MKYTKVPVLNNKYDRHVMIRQYDSIEMENILNEVLSDVIKIELDSGNLISSLYSNQIWFEDRYYQKGDTYVSVYDMINHHRELLLSFIQVGRMYVLDNDYEYLIMPLQKLRAKRKPNYSEYRKIKVVPNSLLERVRMEEGFKKATTENLRIMRCGKELYLNCGTKKVLRYKYIHWKNGYEFDSVSWIEKDWFDAICKIAREGV